MRNKLKALALGVAMAMASSGASAALTDGTNAATGSSLFMTAWADVGGVIRSYTRDLGLTLASLLNETPGNINSATALDAGFNNGTFSNLGDTLFASTFGVGGGLITSGTIHWGVFAVDSTSSPVPAQVAYTTNTPAAGSGGNNGSVVTASGNVSSFITQQNAAGCAATASCSTTGTGMDSSAGSFFAAGLFTANNPFGTAFNTDLDFFWNRTSSATGLSASIRNAFAGSWQLQNNGTVVYASVAEVPLPGALWLLGSGLLGLIAVSRRRKAAAAFA